MSECLNLKPPTKPGRLLSCRAASVILDVSDDTIRRMAKEGRLESVQIGKRCIRVSESSVLSLANLTAKPEGGAA